MYIHKYLHTYIHTYIYPPNLPPVQGAALARISCEFEGHVRGCAADQLGQSAEIIHQADGYVGRVSQRQVRS